MPPLNMSSLRITEIFYSLQGEAADSGAPTVFVRLTGCPLRCHYCDSAYAFHGGERRELAAILAEVAGYRCPRVCVTGGEPLAQPDCMKLLTALADAGYGVSLETSGALSVAEVDPRVSIVMDLKTPDSGELERNLWGNLALLKRKDQIKFVISSRRDYDWAAFKTDELALSERVGHVWFSPAYGVLDPADLAAWILADRLPVRLQMQLHKALWGDRPGV